MHDRRFVGNISRKLAIQTKTLVIQNSIETVKVHTSVNGGLTRISQIAIATPLSSAAQNEGVYARHKTVVHTIRVKIETTQTLRSDHPLATEDMRTLQPSSWRV